CGLICARGTVVEEEKALLWLQQPATPTPLRVRAKVYPGGALTGSNPPADAASTNLDAGGAWTFPSLAFCLPSGAPCSSGPHYPPLALVVWVVAGPPPTETTEAKGTLPFLGKCASQVDCCMGSGSGSGPGGGGGFAAGMTAGAALLLAAVPVQWSLEVAEVAG